MMIFLLESGILDAGPPSFLHTHLYPVRIMRGAYDLFRALKGRIGGVKGR